MTTPELNVILLGAPISGKGTQAERIAARFDLPHISTGEILRAAADEGTEMGRVVQELMEAGELVPDEVVVEVVRERLAQPDAQRGFLLDGFPRNLEQAARLDVMLSEVGRSISHVILIDVPDEELVARSAGRRQCRSCRKGYHVVFNPPAVEGVCDACGGELYRRTDDNEATARHRIEVYHAKTEPLVGFYKRAGLLKSAVCAGKGPDAVFAEIEKLLQESGTA